MTKKNRQAKTLDYLDIQIEHRDGIIQGDPNYIAFMVVSGSYPKILPIPKLKSELSGSPAFLVRTDDIELSLSFSELDRFFRYDLTKKEFEKLHEKYGNFYEISTRFYADGKPWQPKDKSPNVEKNELYINNFLINEKLENQLTKELKNHNTKVRKNKV